MNYSSIKQFKTKGRKALPDIIPMLGTLFSYTLPKFPLPSKMNTSGVTLAPTTQTA